MSNFKTTSPERTIDEPYKRVRYSTGLVLGVDEFEQDQAYFMERDRLLTRALHGYGVVQGLDVNVIDPDNEKVQIEVEPGLAVEPSGQHVCVERPQCAVIKDWLAQQDPTEVFSPSELGTGAGGNGGSNGGSSSPDGEPTEQVCLSVVLRYGTCATDFVPIPGEPCRSAEESRAASRLADDFSLRLEFEKNRPPQVEEHAIRLLGRLLRALEVRSSGKTISVSTLEALVKSVPEVLVSVDDQNIVTVTDDVSIRALAKEAGVTGAEGVVLPEDDSDEPLLRVGPGQEAALLRALEKAWTTHTRRALLEKGHDDQNPLEVGQGANEQCQPVPKGDDGVVLGTLCLSVTPKAKEDANGKETGLQPAAEEENDDGTLNANKQEVKTEDRPRLLASRVLQETGVFGGVEPGGPQESPETPSLEEVAERLPTLPFATADLVDPAELPDVTASDEEVAVRIRFHLNTHETVTTQDNAYDVENFNVQVFSERNEPMTDYLYLTKESVRDRARLGRNVYVLLLRETSVQNRPHLRLRFDLSEMTVNRRAATDDDTRGDPIETVSATEWVKKRPVKWLGHDGTRFVTVFASGRPAGGDLEGLRAAPRVTGLQGTSVSPDDPGEGDHLVFDGTDWRPKSSTPSRSEPVATNAETGLTRIVALSWKHRAPYAGLDDLELEIDEEPDPALGLAVAFGTVTEEGEIVARAVRAETLTQETFRVFVELEGPTPSFANRTRLIPDRVQPLENMSTSGDGGLITGGEEQILTGGAQGAIFLFPERALGPEGALRRYVEENRVSRLEIEIRGDFIIDNSSGRAIDAEFARADLPTGDRAKNGRASEAGVQGGQFESWIYVGVVDLNTASAEELTTLRYVAESVAEDIIDYRDQTEIIDPLSQLSENIRGLTKERIREWRGRIAPPVEGGE